jgi:hypothetical protein
MTLASTNNHPFPELRVVRANEDTFTDIPIAQHSPSVCSLTERIQRSCPVNAIRTFKRPLISTFVRRKGREV